MISTFTTTGNALIAALLTANTTAQLLKVRIGSDVVTPTPSGTDVSGFVYEASIDKIYAWEPNADKVTITIMLDNEIGDFQIGNFMIYAKDSLNGNVPVTLAWASLTQAFPKRKLEQVSSNAGNHLALTLALSKTGIGTALNTANLSSLYVEWPVVVDETQLPSVEEAPSNQYLVDSHTKLNSPMLAIKGTDIPEWLAVPLFTRFDIEDFMVIDGGETGDKYMNNITKVDGGRFSPRITIDRTVDGGAFTGWSLGNTYDGGSFV